MKVTVVIPNYNGEKFIKKCLESLLVQTVTDFKIIIIDNASSDNSILIVDEMFGRFEKAGFGKDSLLLVRLSKNTGFCGGVNEGIKRTKTKYVILLNNDTEVEENFIEESIKGIEKSKNIFSVSPKMVQMCNKALMDNGGDAYTVMGWGFAYGLNQQQDKYNDYRSVFSACGGAAIYRTSIIKKLGYFDENHFAYLEDVDIGYRAKIYGFKNMYNPKAVVYHIGSGTSGSRYNEFKINISARNNIFLIYKNMPVVQLIINMPFIAAGCMVKWLFFRKKGKIFGKAYLEGIKEGIRTFGKCTKVQFRWKNLKNYIKIEIEMIVNAVTYVCDMFKQQ